eukprot:2216014-Pyramimonas_sp.AAC.1
MGGRSRNAPIALNSLPAVSDPAGGAKNAKGGRETSKRAPTWPKSAPREPETAQERFKIGPTWLEDSPRELQDGQDALTRTHSHEAFRRRNKRLLFKGV